MRPENLLEVKVGEEVFGFDADKIEQILRVPAITNIPLSHEAVLGVCVLFGKIYNVIDLGVLLNTKSVSIENESARILTLSKEGGYSAIAVDSVIGMREVDEKSYEECEKNSEGVVGFYKGSDYIVQILDVEDIEERIEIAHFTPKKLDKLNEDSNEESESADSDESRRLLFFKVANEKFAIDIDMLRELIFVPDDITPIAGSDAMGMITLRDDVIALLDIDELLGFESKEADGKSRCLIVQNNHKCIALLVDEVEEVRNISLSQIEELPENFANEKIEAVYKDDKDVSSILSSSYLRSLIREYSITLDESESGENKSEIKDDDMSEIAVFRIADEEYAFDIDEVQEIIAYEETTPIPEAPEFIEGILNLRGSVIPIISLPKRLGFESKITPKSKIIVCITKDEKVGFIVDDVSEILFIEDRYITEVKSEDAIFDEVINLDDGKRVILKIKVSKLLSDDEMSKIQMIKK
jgi:purine-binding chemotaxis protein CheW